METDKEIRIVVGSKTFGETVRVRGGKRQARAYWLKSRAENRLWLLLANGGNADRLSRTDPPVDERAAKVRFARRPVVVRIAILRRRRENLERELGRLARDGTPAKRELLAPVISRQITELSNQIEELDEREDSR